MRLTSTEKWALILVATASKSLGRAAQTHEVCRHHKLSPALATRFRSAMPRLIRKGAIAPWWPVRKPLRITSAGKSLCSERTSP